MLRRKECARESFALIWYSSSHTSSCPQKSKRDKRCCMHGVRASVCRRFSARGQARHTVTQRHAPHVPHHHAQRRIGLADPSTVAAHMRDRRQTRNERSERLGCRSTAACTRGRPEAPGARADLLVIVLKRSADRLVLVHWCTWMRPHTTPQLMHTSSPHSFSMVL